MVVFLPTSFAYEAQPLSIQFEGERIARHNHLRDHLCNTCSSAALSPTREDRALIPGSDARPADVLIPIG